VVHGLNDIRLAGGDGGRFRLVGGSGRCAEVYCHGDCWHGSVGGGGGDGRGERRAAEEQDEECVAGLHFGSLERLYWKMLGYLSRESVADWRSVVSKLWSLAV
jgi:hypothetical protein